MGGQGTIHPPCQVLHYHMVLCPKGTSHNDLGYITRLHAELTTDVLEHRLRVPFQRTHRLAAGAADR